MEWISLLLVMAVELTIAVLYALLATNREWLFPAVVVFEPYSVRPWFLIWKDISGDPMAEENQSIKAYYGKTSVIAGQ